MLILAKTPSLALLLCLHHVDPPPPIILFYCHTFLSRGCFSPKHWAWEVEQHWRRDGGRDHHEFLSYGMCWGLVTDVLWLAGRFQRDWGSHGSTLCLLRLNWIQRNLTLTHTHSFTHKNYTQNPLRKKGFFFSYRCGDLKVKLWDELHWKFCPVICDILLFLGRMVIIFRLISH